MLLAEFGAIDGLQAYVDSMPKAALEAARIALNDVAEGEGLAMIRADVDKEADFPSGYLTNDRLGVTSRAKNNDLAVTITGRFRATSLARFVKNRDIATSRKFGVELGVKRGVAKQRIERAFLVRLRAGATANNDNFNLGLAIRLKPGEALRNSTAAVKLDKGLYLLYGPSIDQIFREVGPKDAPDILQRIEREFYRQFFRLTK